MCKGLRVLTALCCTDAKSMTVSSIQVPARGDQLAVIGDFVTEAAHQAGLDERAAFHVQAAVDEACANIIYHAYDFEGQGPIAVECERAGDDFVITITDHGHPFDPASVPAPDVNAALDERKEGGLGMYLMQQLMDHVEHEFHHSVNVLTMVKHVPSA
jgi:anti-sigma regulatory factor (Ser/Thr protein kinase)